MGKTNNHEDLEMERGVNISKDTEENLVSILEETPIPNRKSFDIKNIADIKHGMNLIIFLKNIKIDKNGEKYIEIGGRKYYEFNGQGTPKESLYIQKGNSLFLGDKFEGLTNREGVSFRYSNGTGEDIHFEQHKAKYTGGIIHLKQMYKSETFSASEIILILKHSGKKIKITKNMIDMYLNGGLNKSTIAIIETAIRLKPEMATYIEKLKNKYLIY